MTHSRHHPEPGGGEPTQQGPAETIALAAGDKAASTMAGPAATSSKSLPTRFGRYRVKRELGRGGMATVYLAEDDQLHREVALKVPHTSSEDAITFSARLIREARSAAALRHAHICPVYEVGEQDGIPYLAMAYIPGRTLAEYAHSPKPQSERSIAITVYKIAQALAEAHAHGVLHRDLKPANIMLDKSGEPLVMDFGLAQQWTQKQSRLTHEGMIVGTPAYMAPEQIDQRAPVGPAADIYALGVVLFELLTQQCPYQGNSISVIGQVLNAPTPQVSQLRPNATPALVAICAKAMAKNPEQRYGSMKEFAAALMQFVKLGGSGTVEALRPIPALDANSLAAATTLVQQAVSLPPATRVQSGPPAWLIFSAAGLAAVALLGIAVAVGSGNRSRTTPTQGIPTNAPGANTNSPPAKSASPVVPAREPDKGPAETSAKPGPTDAPAGDAKNESTTSATEAATGNRPPRPEDLFPFLGKGPPRDPLWEPGGEGQRMPLPELFRRADRNQDFRLDPSEIPYHLILRADQDGDGQLSPDEFKQAATRLKEKFFEPPTAEEAEKLPPPPRDGDRKPPPPPPRSRPEGTGK